MDTVPLPWFLLAWLNVALHGIAAYRLTHHWARLWIFVFRTFLWFQVLACILFNVDALTGWHLWRWLVLPQSLLIALSAIEAGNSLIPDKRWYYERFHRGWRLGFGIGLTGLLMAPAVTVSAYLNFPRWVFMVRLWVCVGGLAVILGVALGLWSWRIKRRASALFYGHAALLIAYLGITAWGMTRPVIQREEWFTYDLAAQLVKTGCLVGWCALWRSVAPSRPRTDGLRESSV